jgi:Uma2 family endonuclease
MGSRTPPRTAPGPFRADQLRPGDRYELSEGHAIYCTPSGGDGAGGTVSGGIAVSTDPDADSAGFDAGFSPDAGTLRAPDLSVGNVPDRPGWIQGVPKLAVEYAGSGQDERELQNKIAELLAAGTRWVWVVRLLGPRHVEVHERGKPVRVRGAGDALQAPGVLRNAVPVEALYDRDAAHEQALKNLLQRRGYDGLEDVREEGREEGRDHVLEQLRAAVRSRFRARGLELDDAHEQCLSACKDATLLARWLGRAERDAAVAEVFA